ncbi:MAG TPA: hypothetical protein DCL15_02460, partial [Chloroflexi bacterium]|nr:hypothetical protein [Chloroflexota bacterium]
MSKSPTFRALLLAAAFGLLSVAWIAFDHYGLRYWMIADNILILGDVPADAIFAVITAAILFLVLRHYLVAQEQVHSNLRRTNDMLEIRVRERTASLEAERKKLQMILDTMPDGVCIIDQNNELIYINPEMERAWGAPAGRKCFAYFGDRDQPCPHCRRTLITAGQTLRWEWRTADSQKTYEVVGSALYNFDGATATLYIFHDVTAQAQARREIEEMNLKGIRQAEQLRLAHTQLSARARELATLLDISHALAATLEVQPLLGKILDQMRTMITYHSAILYLVEDEGITAAAYRGPLPSERVIGVHIPLASMPGCDDLMRCQRPIVIDDLQGEGDMAQAIRQTMQRHFPETMTTRAWMSVPLLINERLIGVLRLDHEEPGFFTRHSADLASAIANQAAVAIENARLYADAHKVAVLEERQRMARDLHDSVSQALYGIALGAHAAREQVERAPARLSGTLDYILAMSATAVAEMRALVFELRPDSLEQEGLRAALAKQADALRARTGATVDVLICDDLDLTADDREMLYRIAQEAMQNIAKHAQARHVALNLQRQDGFVVLEICDDGVGFDATGRFPGHYGLKTMHERALRLHGSLEIESKPQAGA